MFSDTMWVVSFLVLLALNSISWKKFLPCHFDVHLNEFVGRGVCAGVTLFIEPDINPAGYGFSVLGVTGAVHEGPEASRDQWRIVIIGA